MPILLPNLCYIVLQNKPAPIRSEKKHNIIPIILLTNTINRRLQGHSVYVIRNIKFSDNTRYRKKLKFISRELGMMANERWLVFRYRDVVFDPIYSFICYKCSPIAAVVSRSRVKYKYSYFLCEYVIRLLSYIFIYKCADNLNFINAGTVNKTVKRPFQNIYNIIYKVYTE